MTLIRPLPLHLGGTSGEQVSHVCVGCKVEEALCKSPTTILIEIPSPSLFPIQDADRRSRPITRLHEKEIGFGEHIPASRGDVLSVVLRARR